MIISIEERRRIKSLGELDKALRKAGHQVVRYLSPMEGGKSVPKSRVTIVFNGTHQKYKAALTDAKSRGIKILYLELGWLPQRPYNQLDFSGINADASWIGDKLPDKSHVPLELRRGKLLVPLQNDGDVSLTQQSPWFKNMFHFLRVITACSCIPIIVRKHPRHKKKTSSEIVGFVKKHQKLSWDRSASFEMALKKARAVATVNSTAGLEAIRAGRPVLCFGRATYRRPDVAICLDSNKGKIRKAIKNIKNGKVTLNKNDLDSFIDLVLSKQVHKKALCKKVIKMLGAIQ